MDRKKQHSANPFRVPGNYFENFEEHLHDLTTLNDLIPEKQGFRVPEGYFHEFEANVIFAAQKDKNRKSYRRTLLYAAAAIALLFTVTWFVNQTETAYTFEDLNAADIEWLLDSGTLGIPDDYLLNIPESTDLAGITLTESSLQTATLEEYILDESDIYELSE